MKSLFIPITIIFFLLFSCASPNYNSNESYKFGKIIDESRTYFADTLHSLSEDIYDNTGTWGENEYGYKMALRDIYWRADAYHKMSRKASPLSELYKTRRDESISYLKSSMVVDGNVGVWGMPADVENPEFGELISELLVEYPDNFVNGYLYNFNSNDIANLYYDHGRVLTTFCKVYLDTTDLTLVPYIKKAANWLIDKPAVSNVNYNSAAIEGLCYAYLVTSESSYLEKAIEMTYQQVYSQANSNGSFGDSHNQEAWYHGFIVSGLVALKMAMPAEDSRNNDLDYHLTNALKYLEQVTNQGSQYSYQWVGINARVWAEVEELAMFGKWDHLNNSQKDCLANCLYLTMYGEIDVEAEKGFRQQKVLYYFFQTGSAIALF